LATQPSRARLPLSIARWPCGYSALAIVLITGWSARG
jgi:hypothetical protein